ncbi:MULTISPECIES: ABC transporter permease [Bacillus]|uniref:ABC transporter permease n=1 Tax=Bacillus TaxID=1386 RepID=UPI0002DCF380|nr:MULTISPECIES: ABC transporter permease [Bacillus]
MRVAALIKRIALQLLRDKRTLALLFLAPLLVLTLMYFLFNGDTVEPKLGVSNLDTNIVQLLEKANIDVKEYDNPKKTIVVEKDLDGLLQVENGEIKLTLQNDDPTTAKALQMKVNQVFTAYSQMKQQSIIQQEDENLHVDYIYGDKNTAFFDILSPMLITFFVFLFVFLISGIGLLRERTIGTLERLMSTPIRRSEIITGYLVGYGMFAVIQTIIVVLFAVNILDITLVGSIWLVLLLNLIVAFVALSLGILLSTFASSEFQMMQFIPLVIVPQIFFSGIFSLDGVADWLVAVGRIMPLYYAADAIEGVMYKGWNFSDIAVDLLVLLIFAILFIVLNVFAMKKYRKL